MILDAKLLRKQTHITKVLKKKPTGEMIEGMIIKAVRVADLVPAIYAALDALSAGFPTVLFMAC